MGISIQGPNMPASSLIDRFATMLARNQEDGVESTLLSPTQLDLRYSVTKVFIFLFFCLPIVDKFFCNSVSLRT